MAEKKNQKIAAILIRNTVQAPQTVLDTLYKLKLRKKHTCVVIDATESNKGMILKVKDYITYGTINEETEKALIEKRPVKVKKDDKEVTENYFHLQPPKGGFERKGIKRAFLIGGAIGDRREKINELIQRMI